MKTYVADGWLNQQRTQFLIAGTSIKQVSELCRIGSFESLKWRLYRGTVTFEIPTGVIHRIDGADAVAMIDVDIADEVNTVADTLIAAGWHETGFASKTYADERRRVLIGPDGIRVTLSIARPRSFHDGKFSISVSHGSMTRLSGFDTVDEALAITASPV